MTPEEIAADLFPAHPHFRRMVANAIQAAVEDERERWQRALAGGGSIYLGQEPDVVHRIFGVAVDDSKEIGAAQEREACASIVENVAHTCMTDKHCDFLHGAHREAARQIRARSRAKGEG